MLVDDITSIRSYLRLMLKNEPDVEVIAEAENGQIAIEFLNQHKPLPDIIIMDVNMPIMGGIESTQHITSIFPDIKVIAYTSLDDDDTIRNMSKAGASGYLIKECSCKEIMSVIQTAIQ